MKQKILVSIEKFDHHVLLNDIKVDDLVHPAKEEPSMMSKVGLSRDAGIWNINEILINLEQDILDEEVQVLTCQERNDDDGRIAAAVVIIPATLRITINDEDQHDEVKVDLLVVAAVASANEIPNNVILNNVIPLALTPRMRNKERLLSMMTSNALIQSLSEITFVPILHTGEIYIQ